MLFLGTCDCTNCGLDGKNGKGKDNGGLSFKEKEKLEEFQFHNDLINSVYQRTIYQEIGPLSYKFIITWIVETRYCSFSAKMNSPSYIKTVKNPNVLISKVLQIFPYYFIQKNL